MMRKMPRRSWASGRGALVVIALLLLGSAFFRLVGPGAAIALEISGQIKSETDNSAVAESSVANLAPDLIKLLEETRNREEKIE